MVDLAQERVDLAKAEADIAEGEARVAHQRAILAELEHDGHDTTRAKELLEILRRTLEEWRGHRAQIVRMIEVAERQHKVAEREHKDKE